MKQQEGKKRARSGLVSLYTKLVLIIFVLIIALMAVTGVFLTRGVSSFYTNDFYDQMQQGVLQHGAGGGPARQRGRRRL